MRCRVSIASTRSASVSVWASRNRSAAISSLASTTRTRWTVGRRNCSFAHFRRDRCRRNYRMTYFRRDRRKGATCGDTPIALSHSPSDFLITNHQPGSGGVCGLQDNSCHSVGRLTAFSCPPIALYNARGAVPVVLVLAFVRVSCVGCPRNPQVSALVGRYQHKPTLILLRTACGRNPHRVMDRSSHNGCTLSSWPTGTMRAHGANRPSRCSHWTCSDTPTPAAS